MEHDTTVGAKNAHPPSPASYHMHNVGGAGRAWVRREAGGGGGAVCGVIVLAFCLCMWTWFLSITLYITLFSRHR